MNQQEFLENLKKIWRDVIGHCFDSKKSTLRLSILKKSQMLGCASLANVAHPNPLAKIFLIGSLSVRQIEDGSC